MNKVFISPSKLKSGMKIAQTILNDYGSMVIAEDTIVDDHIMKKLLNLSIDKIKVYEDDKENSVYISDGFMDEYNENVESVKLLLTEAASGNGINVIVVNKVVDTIVNRAIEKRDIVRCINQVKDVDEYTYNHSVNVSLLSMLIGKWLGFTQEKLQLVTQAGLLHDIGKVNIPLGILNKPGKLTGEEYEEIKKHSVYGYRMLENSTVSKEVSLGVLMHHEREDGKGYPTGAKGDKINAFAKVIAVADIYDAMTSNRVYRGKESPFEVFELMEEKTIGELDTKVVYAFLHNIAAYYIGDSIKLSSGELGEVVYINPRHISRPIVKVGENYYDLSKNSKLKIEEII